MGRPLKWTDPKGFEEAVENYFEQEKAPTWSGLALHLGFASRDSLNDYKKKEGFSDPIKRALLRIEESYEKSLREARNAAGPIFALKNFNWKDRHEIDQKTEHSGGLTIRIIEGDTSGAGIQEESKGV